MSYAKRSEPWLTVRWLISVLSFTATSTTEPSSGFWNASSWMPALVLPDFTRAAPGYTNRLKWPNA